MKRAVILASLALAIVAILLLVAAPHSDPEIVIARDCLVAMGTDSKIGVPTQMVALEGESHGFTDANNQKAMQQMLDFLSERLEP